MTSLVKRCFAFSFVLVLGTVAKSEEWYGRYVQLVPDSSENFSGGGLIYGAEGGINAHLNILDEEREVVLSLPVIFTLKSLGYSVYYNRDLNFTFSLRGTDGKTVKQLIGTYWGVKAGIGLFGFAKAGGFVNWYGVTLGQAGGGLGYGADFSAAKLNIQLKRSHHDHLDDTVWSN